MCFLIIGKKVCLNYTPWCAIVHTLVCTKTHLGVLFNTPVLRVLVLILDSDAKAYSFGSFSKF